MARTAAKPKAKEPPVDLTGLLDGFPDVDRPPSFLWVQFGHKLVMVTDGDETKGAFEVPLDRMPEEVAALLPTEITVAGEPYRIERRNVAHQEGTAKVPALLMRGLNYVFFGKRPTIWELAKGQPAAPYAAGAHSKDQYVGVWLDAWPHITWFMLTVSSKAAQAVGDVVKALEDLLRQVQGRTKRSLPQYAVAVPLLCGEVTAMEDGGSVVAIEHGLPAGLNDMAAFTSLLIPPDVREFLADPQRQAEVRAAGFVPLWEKPAQADPDERPPRYRRTDEYTGSAEDEGEPRPFPEGARRPAGRGPATPPQTPRPPLGGNGSLRVKVTLDAKDVPAQYHGFLGTTFADIAAQEGGLSFIEWVARRDPTGLNPGAQAISRQAANVIDTLASA